MLTYLELIFENNELYKSEDAVRQPIIFSVLLQFHFKIVGLLKAGPRKSNTFQLAIDMK